jgi:serine/threonine protein kinase/tetratricopeptide (TPR) repeat protein
MGQLDTRTMQDLSGRTLGHYRIVEKIGAGGMGVVYRARDERLDRDVAIKVLHEAVAQEPDRLARFEREAKVVAKLAHPNILEIWDFGSEEGIVYAVTELLEGESLRTVIASGGLSTAKALEYARVIAEGLAAAHEKGIVHRDLKPENVFLTRDGRIKILDFGLAKLELRDADLTTETPTATLETAPGGILGTVAYMAPEQVQGRPADHRCDLFALGVVLYEMLTGHRPFGGPTTMETAAAILKQDPVPISVAAPTVPPTLGGVVSKCLEKRAEDRFSSAHDLALTLRTIDTAISVPPLKDRLVISKRWPHILAVVIAAVIGLLVILPPEALVELLTGTTDTSPIRSIALLPLENLTGDPEQLYFVDGLHGELINTFAHISAFEKVTARTSVMGLRDSETPIHEIGEKLGVEAVLEGSVRRSGDTVRVTLQLIEASGEQILWADKFDRDLTNILALQAEVARAVAGEVRLALSPDEERRLEETRTVEREAYEAYLRGLRYLNSGLTEENYKKAIGFFETSIDKDPTYAPAHVGLSQALRGLTFRYRPPIDVMPRARTAALRALELDSDLAEAHEQLGNVKFYWEWDWKGTETEFERALALNSNSASLLTSYAASLVCLGRLEEAVALQQRAVQLDPVSARPLRNLGWVFGYARRYEDAIGHLLEVIELYPNDVLTHFYLAWNYWGIGLQSEALASLDRVEEIYPAHGDDPFYIAVLAFTQGSTGKSREAEETLQRLLEMRKRQYVPPWLVAVAYAGIGDKDRAIVWLERAYETRDVHLLTSGTNPALDSLRTDPRFQDILRRINLPDH